MTIDNRFFFCLYIYVISHIYKERKGEKQKPVVNGQRSTSSNLSVALRYIILLKGIFYL